MLLTKALISALAFGQYARAFHPFIPAYRCILDESCNPDDLESDGQVQSRDEGFTLPLVQRTPTIGIPHAIRVRREAERLAHKFERSSPSNGISKRVNKFNVVTAATPTQSNSAGINQDGTDFSYFASVTVGSSNTPIYMLLDTGAGTSWIMGSSCVTGACLLHNTFGPSDSTTLKSTGGTFSIAYGSGMVAGDMYTDNLSLAGITMSMNIGLANTTSNQFGSFPFDGILGLSQAVSNTPNFLQTLVTSKKLKSNVFGVYLSRTADGPNNGEINFGAPDTSKYSGGLTYFPVDSSAGGDWAIALDKVGNGTASSSVANKLAYVDTGTSFIFTSPADAATFHAMIPGAKGPDNSGSFTVPCTTTANMTFTFGSTTITVSPKDWVGPVANGICTSNVFGQNIVTGGWLLGDTFLKNVYALFDVDGDRLGLAQRTETVTASSTTASGTSSSPSSASTLPGSTIGTTSGTASSIITGVTTTLAGTISTSTTISNGLPTGTSTATSSSTASTSATGTSSPGMNGHESSSASNTAAAETTAPSASATPKNSGASHFNTNLFTSLAVMVLLGMIS